MKVYIPCPVCSEPHIDHGKLVSVAHRNHTCTFCGHEWAPFSEKTIGVSFIKAENIGEGKFHPIATDFTGKDILLKGSTVQVGRVPR